MTEEAEQLFVFNGVDASGDYMWSPMTAHQVVGLAQGKSPDEVQNEAVARRQGGVDFPVKEGVDPESIAQSGWGVVFAHGADPAIREALQPLLRYRAEQAGELYREFWGPDAYRPGERKTKFLARHKAPTSGPVDPVRMPFYLLLVGSPDAIPTEFQAQLAIQYAVGRLHFDTVEEYDSYARSVLASEKGEVKVARRLGLWGPRNPNDRATSLSSEGLIEGLERYVTSTLPTWSLDVRSVERATKAQLAQVLGGDQTPAVLFTASHGVGFAAGHDRQRLHQGALLCQDWGGPRTGPLTPDLYFSGDDLGDSARLTGLISFFFACYGGGMPKFDAFSHGRSERKQIAEEAFFAALPKRMLGHPRGGALAAVGHIERAWGCSFFEPRVGHQIAVFESFMHRLLEGCPVGLAMEYFGSRYGEVSSDLLQKLEDLKYDDPSNPSVSEIEIANDWTAANDARNYVILGDPAVRVSVADDGQALERPVLELRTGPSAPAQGPAVTQAPAEASATQQAAETQATQEGLESFGLFSKREADAEAEPEAKAKAKGGGVLDSLKGFVSKLGDTLSRGLADMTTLEVRTYVAGDLDDVTIDDRGLPQGARLRGYTRVALDGDTVVCIPERDGEIDRAAFEVHTQVVAQAQQARAELFKTFADAAASLVRFTQ